MGNGEQLALDYMWWSWNHPAIHHALSAALAQHAIPVVDNFLQDNRRHEREPSAWKQLGHPGLLRRNERNIRRVKAGEIEMTYSVLLSLATVAGVPVQRLVPAAEEWIAAVAFTVCCGTLTREEALSYARYRVGLLDSADTSVLSAARKLGPVLETMDRDLRRNEG